MAAKRRKLTKIIRLGLLATLLPMFLSSAEGAPRLVYVKKSTREATILADASLLLTFLQKEKRVNRAIVDSVANERRVNLKGEAEA